MPFVYRRWMKADRLIIRTVAKPFAILDEQFGIEAPSNDRAGHNVVIAVEIGSVRYVEELTTPARIPGPVESQRLRSCRANQPDVLI